MISRCFDALSSSFLHQMKAAGSKLNYASMNVQQDAFCIASDNGVQIFNTQPLVLLQSIDKELTGNAKIASILHRSNLICFVGGGRSIEYPSNTALIWDNKKNDIILEYTVPGGPILNVLMSTTFLVIVQQRDVHIFSFPQRSKCIRTEAIRQNPLGLGAMSCETANQLLAVPDQKIGTVRLVNLNSLSEFESLSPSSIEAHKSELAHLALNNQGTLLATGSEKGTVIRLFDTRTCRLLRDLRRGTVQATLHCLSFSPCSTYLAVSSDKGTIHIFRSRGEDTSAKSQVMGHGAMARVTIEKRVLACGFANATSTSLQSLVVVCADGTFHRFSFNSEGTTQREAFEKLPELAEEQEFWDKPI